MLLYLMISFSFLLFLLHRHSWWRWLGWIVRWWWWRGWRWRWGWWWKQRQVFFFKTFSMLRAVYVEMVVTPLWQNWWRLFLIKWNISSFFFSTEDEKMEIIDHTETNLVALRRTIYLTIQSRYCMSQNLIPIQKIWITIDK